MQFPAVIFAGIWAIVSYVLYKIISNVIRARQIAKRSRELNCEDPTTWKTKLPLGVDFFLDALKADKRHEFPSFAFERITDLGSITFSVYLFGIRMYFTADEENIKAMLGVQFKDFDLGPHRRGNFWPLLGNGIFTQDGHSWEHSRAMLRPQFARDQISDLELEECHVQNMMRAVDAYLPRDGSGWIKEIDLHPLFFRLTLDSATEFLFGKSIDSQVSTINQANYNNNININYNHISKNENIKKNKNHIQAEAFAKAFDEAQKVLSTRHRLGELYWIYSPRKFKKDCKICHDFIDHFVRLALAKEPREKNFDAGEKYVFLDALVAETRDPIELRSQLLNVLLAGRDTTASLLTWLFYSLAKDPPRYKKLRDVILAEFGTYENPTNITFSRIKSCQYLQYCNSEALRLYPVVPLNGRYSNKDTTLPRGGGKDGKSKIFIPKGTIVDYSVYVMHHRKEIWGEDAEEFIPERWQGKKVGWEYLPFNGGPRICIGQQFALTEASYVTIRLLQRFDSMSLVYNHPITKHDLTLTNSCGNGVKVRLHCDS